MLITGFFFASFFFAFVVIPLVFALRSMKVETGKARTRWLLGIMLLWPVAPWLYGWKKGSARDRWAVVGSIVASFAAMVLVFQLVKAAIRTASSEMSQAGQTALTAMVATKMDAESMQRLDLTTKVLKTELEQNSIWALDEKLTIMNLAQILIDMTADGRLERQEFDLWMKLVNDRANLERDILFKFRNGNLTGR